MLFFFNRGENLIIVADTDVRFVEQSERITVLENEVRDWSDNITALEQGVSEVQQRLDALEEVVTSMLPINYNEVLSLQVTQFSKGSVKYSYIDTFRRVIHECIHVMCVYAFCAHVVYERKLSIFIKTLKTLNSHFNQQ